MCAKKHQKEKLILKNDDKAFVIGDIHGMYEPLEKMLENWQADEQLIFLGDYIDRGPQILEVLHRVWQLESDYGAICLRGNHEQMLLNFLTNPVKHTEHYIRNGGWETIRQLLHSQEESLLQKQLQTQKVDLVRQIIDEYPRLLSWLESLPYYYEFGNFVCVHAGVDLSLDNWRKSSKRDFIWIREPFFDSQNKTGRQFIFGHTPMHYLPSDRINHGIFVSSGLWGIDGGAVYQNPSSHLIGLKLDENKVLNSYRIPVVNSN